ncbi:zn-finger domain-containing protein [Gigaspora margarita]|uniref:Zn-finger domain-containing protein n=1 Tax=Gigaspora margarita TaxID=4874 RepID=A0A8H3X540_GIGMA|nr:zn-finger domain-containing protein [Gigaspora margarita]
MTICVKNAEATGQIIANNSAHIRNYSKSIKSVKQKQKNHVDINEYYSNSDNNEYYSNSEFFAKTISFKDIKFQKVSKQTKSIKINSSIDLNSTYAGPSGASSSDEEIVQKFSNEAYANLMVLITKYKLSNVAGNAIILFFNKHSKHSKSPLPKNIKQDKEFMNNIKSNLSYKKTKVLELDNTEYFLYHMDLISCIESKLEISNIAQHLEFEYKELYKTTENSKEITHKEQNNGIW